MARTRQLSDLATDARRLADLENAALRFPDAEVYEYVNKGIAFCYRAIITAQDRPFYQSDHKIVTDGRDPSVYPLSGDFLRLTSVMWATSAAGPWATLDPVEEAELTSYLNSGHWGAQYPHVYSITGGDGAFTQGTIPTAYGLWILPKPPVGSVIWYRYIPTPPRLLNPTDTFDGILGFEDAACTWAAVLMRRKDDLPTVDLERDMARHMDEIAKIARRRDGRPGRIQRTRRPYSRGMGPSRGWRY